MTDANKINPFYHSQNDDTEEDKKLLEPFKYVFQSLGEHTLTKLTRAFNYWLKVPDERYREIDEIVDIIYTTSLLFDDIQDNSNLREGFRVAHSVYGLPNTINAGNYVTIIALEKIVNLHPAAMKIYIEELLKYNRGQGMDMYWKDNFICPTETEYKTMAVNKTSWIVMLAVRLMKLFSTYKGDLSSLIASLALYYQIANDYCNLCTEHTKNKDYCDDLTEGKFSFLVIHALTSNPDDKQILNILKQRTRNIMVKRQCIELLKISGSFEYTKNVLEKMELTVRAEIDGLGGNPFLMNFMDDLRSWDTAKID